MKDYYKQPDFYYVLIPAIITLWAVIAWMVSVPTAEKKWDRSKNQYSDAQTHIERILTLDAERLDYEKNKGKDSEFDYATAVEQFAGLWKIPSSAYSLQAGREIKRGGRRTKTANVSIKPVNIEKFCQFLSTILLRWPDLQCDQLKLSKLPGGPDSWKADIKLTYNY